MEQEKRQIYASKFKSGLFLCLHALRNLRWVSISVVSLSLSLSLEIRRVYNLLYCDVFHFLSRKLKQILSLSIKFKKYLNFSKIKVINIIKMKDSCFKFVYRETCMYPSSCNSVVHDVAKMVLGQSEPYTWLKHMSPWNMYTLHNSPVSFSSFS